MNVVKRVISLLALSGLPRRVQIGIYGLAGVAVGVALIVACIANATSYLSGSPSNPHELPHHDRRATHGLLKWEVGQGFVAGQGIKLLP